MSEEKIRELEEKIKKLEGEIERLKAVHEIQNLMSKYEYYHTAQRDDKIAEMFAERAEDISAEIAFWGRYKGSQGTRKLYAKVHPYLYEKAGLGSLFIHTLTTPVIEVAKDGQTAKGVWISPGIETSRVNGKLQATWCWIKYGVDFVKENGKWKFWRLKVYRIFRCPYEKSWVEMPEVDPGPFELPEELKPDEPSVYDRPYSPWTKPDLVPEPPEPYDTWDGKSMVLPSIKAPGPYPQT
ncbi:MAG: nuclear transport factor 2 family protein [Candidatus Bathyarchaeia archaeon]